MQLGGRTVPTRLGKKGHTSYPPMLHSLGTNARGPITNQRDVTMKFEIKNRWSGEVMFVTELEASLEALSVSVQLGAAIKKAVSTGAALRGADLTGADLRGADLTGAYLRGAYLRG